MQYHTGLSDNEWYIMQVLWEKSPAGLRDICGALPEKKKWSRHAVTSFLNRLLEKGAISVDESGNVRQYRAVWEKEDTVREETESILERVYHGNLFCMVSNAVKGGKSFSQKEIEELKQLLDSMEEAEEK